MFHSKHHGMLLVVEIADVDLGWVPTTDRLMQNINHRFLGQPKLSHDLVIVQLLPLVDNDLLFGV